MEKINLGGVSETMIQTLYARAKESKRPDPVIYDETAIAISEALSYDFREADADTMMSDGVIARTYLLDAMVNDYLALHPDAVVVNLACGLDTRFYRVDNGRIRWYNLDLPEVIDVRKTFLKEEGRVSQIACSAMEERWGGLIEARSDTLVIVEGLTMYLSEADVRKILDIIGKSFASATVFMETMSPFSVKHIHERSIEKSEAKFSWGIRDGRALAAIAPEFRFVCDRSLTEGMKVLKPSYRWIAWIPLVRRIANKITVLQKKEASR